MENNITEIKLGAPQSIEINGTPKLEDLDVQITERLDSVVIKGDTGTKNPFEIAADLLIQQELEMSEDEGLRPEVDGLPVRYMPYEYISNIGLSSTIDSGIAINGEPFEVELDFTMTSADQQSWTSYPELMCINGLYYASLAGYSGTKVASAITPVVGRHKIIAKYNQGENGDIVSLQIDDNLPTESAIGKFSSTNTFKLFYGILTGFSTTNRFHKVTMKLNGIVVRNFIPVKDRVLFKDGMYDLVENKFYFEGVPQGSFQCFNKLVDDSISLNIPTDAILNGGDTKVEISDGDAKNYYWQLTNINPESTGHPTIDQQGNISIEDGKWAEFDVKVKRYADASWKSHHFILNQNAKGE